MLISMVQVAAAFSSELQPMKMTKLVIPGGICLPGGEICLPLPESLLHAQSISHRTFQLCILSHLLFYL